MFSCFRNLMMAKSVCRKMWPSTSLLGKWEAYTSLNSLRYSSLIKQMELWILFPQKIKTVRNTLAAENNFIRNDILNTTVCQIIMYLEIRNQTTKVGVVMVVTAAPESSWSGRLLDGHKASSILINCSGICIVWSTCSNIFSTLIWFVFSTQSYSLLWHNASVTFCKIANFSFCEIYGKKRWGTKVA